MRAEDQRLEPAAGLLGRAPAEAVEPVGGEDGALHEPLDHRLAHARGAPPSTAPGSRAPSPALWTVAAAIRAPSPSKPSRAPSPTRTQRRPSARATATWRCFALASPASSSAPRGSPGRSCGMPSPSKIPTAIVSAPVSAGACVVAVMRMGRAPYVTRIPRPCPTWNDHGGREPHAQDRHPRRRPHADRQARRRPEHASTPRSSAASRSRGRSSAPTWGRRRSSTSSWARSCRRGRARSPRARRRSRPASRRRSPPRPSTRSAPPASARRAILDAQIRAGRGRDRRGRRHGVDVAGSVPAAPGPLRLPHGRRQGARRDGPRRPDEPVQRPPDVRRGHRGRRRARAHAPRPRPLGPALSRARASRPRTRAACPRRSSP